MIQQFYFWVYIWRWKFWFKNMHAPQCHSSTIYNNQDIEAAYGLKIYWAWPHPSEQDPASPIVSLSDKEASISLSSWLSRRQTEWKPQSQKANQTDHMDHSLVKLALWNSMKLWAMLCRANQGGEVIV